MYESTDVTTDFMTARSSTLTGNEVWDRVWQAPHSEKKDDTLLANERRNPRWLMIVERLTSTFGSLKGLRTIELGSGRGDLSTLLAQQGAQVTLLDASEKALGQARHRFSRLELSAEFRKGDIFAESDTSQGRYDVTLSSGVIEHFKGQERSAVIAAHHRLLRPGGIAIISVPHAWCLPYRVWKKYLELRGCWPYGFELPYSRRELIQRSRDAGLVSIETKCLGFWHSISAHWLRNLAGYQVDWSERKSIFDASMGLTLLMMGRRAS